MPYDPVSRHLEIEKIAVLDSPQGQLKKYYRFRKDRWYGGIVTADCVGCGLACKFCWVKDDVLFKPGEVGGFYSPAQVAEKLIFMAGKTGIEQLRVSGGEPTIGRKHLIQLLDSLKDRGYRFILETNGILIGADPEYATELSRYSFLHVRVSLKGTNKEEFAVLTGASTTGFELQLSSLENLVNAGVRCHPSAMVSFSSPEGLKQLTKIIADISSELADQIEIEELILYPDVKRRLEKFGLKYRTGYAPDNIPQELI